MKRIASKLLTILLVLCMALTLLPGTALATEAAGICVDGLTWSLSNGILTIQGTGDMSDYSMNSIPWHDYYREIHTVIIGNNVTSIGDCAFSNCYSITSVTIPDEVTSIGKFAFAECWALRDIIIPNSITSIGMGAFDSCLMLESVSLPSSITTIANGQFANCRNLSSIVIPEGVTAIDDAAFYRCGLSSVTIPASITRIGGDAFSECIALKDVYYNGSESQWNQISIAGKNTQLSNVSIHYNGASSSNDLFPPTSAGISVTFGSNTVTWTDAEPFIDANSRTMVPLRAVADAMGLDVNWDDAWREASFTRNGRTIYFPIGSSTAHTNDRGPITMDTAAVIVNDRTYAPIRYLAEYFGYKVGWDAAARTVIITV